MINVVLNTVIPKSIFSLRFSISNSRSRLRFKSTFSIPFLYHKNICRNLAYISSGMPEPPSSM